LQKNKGEIHYILLQIKPRLYWTMPVPVYKTFNFHSWHKNTVSSRRCYDSSINFGVICRDWKYRRARVPRNNTEIMNETTVAPPTTAAPPAHTAWPMTSSITTPVCYHTSGLQPTSSRASDASTIEAVDISDVTKQPTVQHLLTILLIPRLTIRHPWHF